MRRDLHPVQTGDEIAVGLRILTARRYDLTAAAPGRSTGFAPRCWSTSRPLERALDYSVSKAAPVLLTRHQNPAALRGIGKNRLAAWLKTRKVRRPRVPRPRRSRLPGTSTLLSLGDRHRPPPWAAKTAKEVMALDEEIAETDRLIVDRFRKHRHTEVITSLPGIGTLLGAEFIALTGDDMTVFGTPDRLTGVAGLALVPRDSGCISGKLHRPYSRLLPVFYLAAQVAARHCPLSKTFYDRKRAEGKSHKQAILAFAARRLNVEQEAEATADEQNAGTPRVGAGRGTFGVEGAARQRGGGCVRAAGDYQRMLQIVKAAGGPTTWSVGCAQRAWPRSPALLRRPRRRRSGLRPGGHHRLQEAQG
ncbi:transposase [Streptomyces sp. TX20-6-3]|uniref:transposase n=1 Tax=Streptomyces sp. TX20-6-3 TaxID=3028705 RepID=UPI0029C09A38|nr:transposase [Streptomyces sp. TX20-6-3]